MHARERGGSGEVPHCSIGTQMTGKEVVLSFGKSPSAFVTIGVLAGLFSFLNIPQFAVQSPLLVNGAKATSELSLPYSLNTHVSNGGWR